MAAIAPRDRNAFTAHWAKIMADPSNLLRTVLVDEQVAGNVVSWREPEGDRVVGYWIGREHWGKGVATTALSQFLDVETTRPLRAYVATHNVASIRVLQKCGFVKAGGPAVSPDLDDGVEEFLMRLDA
jgi:RimJ/RimL family protein N-acetyltransferase